jgi:hypothetical protein
VDALQRFLDIGSRLYHDLLGGAGELRGKRFKHVGVIVNDEDSNVSSRLVHARTILFHHPHAKCGYSSMLQIDVTHFVE